MRFFYGLLYRRWCFILWKYSLASTPAEWRDKILIDFSIPLSQPPLDQSLLPHTRTSNLQPRFARTNFCTTSASSGLSVTWHSLRSNSKVKIQKKDFSFWLLTFYFWIPPKGVDQPAAYYPSRTCWLFLVSVYTFGKTCDTFWHIHLMFYLIVYRHLCTKLKSL